MRTRMAVIDGKDHEIYPDDRAIACATVLEFIEALRFRYLRAESENFPLRYGGRS